MRHIDITVPRPSNGLADFIVTKTSNNFGDQILELKKYTKKGNLSGYEVIEVVVNGEGQWVSDTEIVSMFKFYIERAKI